MLKTSTIVCLLLVIMVSMQNCNIIDPKEITPTYIHIDSFRTANNFSHKITAVWVYYNNSPVGVFDLPATFPVMATGTGKVLFAPGIAVNGQNSTMTNYPFYTIDTLTLTAQPGKVVTYQPFTDYYATLNVRTISDFENGFTNFSKVTGNAVIVPVRDSLKFEGEYSGAIFLNAVGDSSVDSSISNFTIAAGRPAFIEFNYRSTIPFAVGLEGTLAGLISTGPYFLAGIKPSDQWQKFYLNVQAFATQYNATYYHFYLKASLGEGQTSGRLLIDNIKLITF